MDTEQQNHGELMTKRILILILLATPVHATDYYLDCDLSTGTNTGASWDNAWRTFDDVVWSGAGVDDGDTLFLSGDANGTTCHITTSILLATGSAGQLVQMRVGQDTGHNGEVYIDGGDVVTTLLEAADYATVDGEVGGQRRLTFQNWATVGTGGDFGQDGRAINGNNDDFFIVRYVDVINDDYTCTDCANFPWKNCITLLYANDNLLEYNYLDGCVENSIIIGATGTATGYDDNIVQYNTIQSYYSQDGLGGADGAKSLDGTTVRYNDFIYSEATDAWYNPDHQAEDGAQVQGDYVKIYGNTFVNVPASAIRTDQVPADPGRDYVWIYNNLIHRTEASSLLARGIEVDTSSADTTNMRIWNNTISGMSTYMGIHVNMASASVADIDVVNNLIVGSGIADIRVTADSGTYIDQVVVDYNLAMNATLSGEGVIERRIVTTNTPYTQTNNPYDSGEVLAFASYSEHDPNNDYHLADTATMAIGAGINLYSDFTTDIDGDSRNPTNPWDLGAYVYDGDYVPPPTTGNPVYSDGVSILTGD